MGVHFSPFLCDDILLFVCIALHGSQNSVSKKKNCEIQLIINNIQTPTCVVDS
jgi:hypothetical protein